MPERIFEYFPSLSETQKDQFLRMEDIYRKWNSMINVISRKDMENFVVHHVLHSLSIAKAFSFPPGSKILDVGTGGGFPGIPLAILFPRAEFTLLDSTGKKIKVVNAAAAELGLENAFGIHKRAEEEKEEYDFIVSRAVTDFISFVSLVSKNISHGSNRNPDQGIIYLKGGDLSPEQTLFHGRLRIWNIRDFFTESYFETKKIVYLPI